MIRNDFAKTLNDSIAWNNAVDAEFKKEQTQTVGEMIVVAMPRPAGGGGDDDKIAA
jgi:hypothetical protein